MSHHADRLNSLLADHQVFYNKLRNYHWNVKGPLFYALHAKFEELYDQVNLIVDELAERVVALGERPLSTMKEQLAAATLKEDETVPTATAMVDNVLADLKSLVSDLESARDAATNDSVTANLLDGFVDGYAGPTWMLKSFRADG